MQTPQRQRQSGLIDGLFAEPWRFRFTSAVTLLLGWLARRGVPHDEAMTRVLRFENSLSLGFPAAEVETLCTEEAEGGERIVMTPRNFGLLGAAGALPLHLTDRCAHAAAQGDPGARAWLDICSSRMVALFWQAWAKSRIELAPVAEGRDTGRAVMLALCGKQGTDCTAAPWYAGLLRTRPVSAASLQRILAGELGLPVSVDSLSGSWDVIGPHLRSTLDAHRPVLGSGVVLGKRQWRLDRRLRIVIGPLRPPDFDRMLPCGAGAQLVRRLLVLATAQALLEFEILLLPDPECTRPIRLTGQPGSMQCLGWGSALAGTPPGRREIRYLLDLRKEVCP